jgi:hypothetical protein
MTAKHFTNLPTYLLLLTHTLHCLIHTGKQGNTRIECHKYARGKDCS